ncbi:hypothetical protein [Gordonia sp. OPL2]|uniref:hypothetical protein n=1 Tax=Gordonia sp. OPL2 TaxID=2486274 RepID=UPI0016551CC6|nr:hypothetical protein [Gordonia sp. OPL2]ROZ89026.1 hypothetical protein EEB19_20165 [Gordonia sp. OPL2]
MATFTLPEIPDVTFTVTRGSDGESGLPSNWINIRGTRPGTPTDDDPEPDPVVVSEVGFAGP